MKTSIILLLFGACAVMAGCYYHNEEELYPNCSVDPANTKYSTTISNILISYGCTGCHVAPVPSGGIRLDTYDGVHQAATTIRNGQSILSGAVNHSPNFEPMPQGAGKMNACDIRKIEAWIHAGALNN